MPHQFFLDGRPQNGLTYKEYLQIMKQDAENSNNENRGTIKLNLQRTIRIDKTYDVNPELKKLVRQISSSLLLMVLTEDWCGDSAQNLPCIAKIAACNPSIDLKILLRDQNLDIMDLYLTDGKSRSIPKLVIFDKGGNELIQWGPRPLEAQTLVKEAKTNGKSKEDFMHDLHLWYGKNRGRDLENEFKEIFEHLLKI